MIQLLLAGALLLAGPVQDQERDAVDPKVRAAAVEDLERAFKKGEPKDRVDAIQRQYRVVDAEVIRWIGKGLGDKEREVKAAAIEALRWMDHPHALDALHAKYKSDKKLERDGELYAALIRAFAQHGSPESIEYITSNPLNKGDRSVARARVLGLGMIRSKDAVEGVMGLMRKAGMRKMQSHMDDVRISLMILTGQDHGRSQAAWTAWWNDNKKTFEVAEKPPKLPQKMQQAWNRYWGLEVEYERPKKRRERGGGEH